METNSVKWYLPRELHVELGMDPLALDLMDNILQFFSGKSRIPEKRLDLHCTGVNTFPTVVRARLYFTIFWLVKYKHIRKVMFLHHNNIYPRSQDT